MIARGFRQNETDALRHNLKEGLTFKGEKEELVHVDGDFFLFSHGAPLRVDNDTSCLYLFDGHVFYKNTFLHTLLDIKTKQVEEVFDALENKAMNDVSGVFCTAKIDLKTKGFRLYCDPLSQYPIASWESGNSYVVSNNVLLIEKFLQFHGYKLQRDPLCMLRNAIAVLNVSLTSPYKEISFQPPRTALHGGTGLTRRELFTWQYLCSPSATYDECLEAAAERLKDKCNALIGSMPGHYIMSDLTGGMDSRMVFAALLASGNSDVIEFWCNTRYPHPDANIADHIIDRYKLRQGTTLLNGVNEDFTIEQSISRGLFRNRGARYKDWSGLGQGYFPKMVRLNGCFGEIGRSNVLSNVFKEIGRSDVPSNIFKKFGRSSFGLKNFSKKTIQHLQNVGSLELITEKGKHEIADPIQDMVVQMSDMGIPQDSMSDMLYLEGRGRYHFGHYFACNNGLFISPCLIYDLNLVWANAHLSSEERFSGKAQFDLIRMLGGDELVEVPLADKRWAESIIPSNMKQKLKNVESITRHSPALSAGKNTMSWRLGWKRDKATVVKHNPPPAFAKGRSAAWANLPEYQALASKLLEQTDGSEAIFEYVDRGKLRAITKTDPATIQKEWTVWALQVVVAGIMWDLGQEEGTPISLRYEGEYPN